MHWRQEIAAVADFAKPGILFRDMMPVLANVEARREMFLELEQQARLFQPTVVVGVESRGFILGAPLAERLMIPFLTARKPGKLPGEIKSIKYALEYGEDELQMQAGVLRADDRVLIVDDLLATGGTAKAAIELSELAGGTVVGALFMIELKGLNGRDKLLPKRVESLITYD